MAEKVVYESDLRAMVEHIISASKGQYHGEEHVTEQTLDDIMFSAGLPSHGMVKIV